MTVAACAWCRRPMSYQTTVAGMTVPVERVAVSDVACCSEECAMHRRMADAGPRCIRCGSTADLIAGGGDLCEPCEVELAEAHHTPTLQSEMADHGVTW